MANAAITVDLDGRSLQLTPSSAAAFAISSRFGGLMPALHAVVAANIDAITLIIAAGTSGIDNDDGLQIPQVAQLLLDQEAEVLRARVYRHGAITLVDPVSEFVSMLANGGHRQEAQAA